jgi:transposase
VNGVLWRTRTGSPWRDLPESYGRWKTVYNRHRRWSADGTWADVLNELQRGCDQTDEPWVVAIDSTVVRAHHNAAGARHEPPSDVPAEVLASALAEELAAAVTPPDAVLADGRSLTGGTAESHESPSRAGQTTRS